jgi:predicted ATPase
MQLKTQLPEQRLVQIHFESFKSFEQYTQIDLSPVTLIAGINSSGKTGILQSLLLARQTLITPYRQTVEEALNYGSLGFTSFHELVFRKTSTRGNGGIQLGFTVQIKPDWSSNSSPSLEQYFTEKLPTTALGKLVSVDLNVQFDYDEKQKIVIARQIEMRSYLEEDQTKYSGPMLILENKTSRWRITQLRGGKISLRSFNFHPELLLKIGQRVGVNRFLPVLTDLPDGTSSKLLKPEKLFYGMFRTIFSPALTLLREELEKRIFYVGPLRSAPQRSYLPQSVVGLEVGASGEKTVQLLHQNLKKLIRFVEVPDDLAKFHPAQVRLVEMPLKDAVQQALRLLGIEQQLKITKGHGDYRTLLSLLSQAEEYVSIVDVGFGVSQILPIIAVSLLSPVNSILIFEQPEIHLHPRAQAGLGELFLCLARTGRRVLVETHSENLINRLRRRIAEDDLNRFENWVNILFVHPPAEGSGATVEKGRIDRYGNLENWPPTFLAESAIDTRAIILAGSNKRLAEKSRGSSK